MPERRVTVAIAEGLHARPAALFVKLAGEQPCPVTIRRPDGDPVPAASILSVMTLGARAGDDVVLAAEGPDAEAALDALAAYLTAPEPAA
ncbi:MAG: HPr family phosphocarrier protein [Actinomycetales bacterium]|nr:HPr family phosphocarrier protein [Actinomycetales bacterium]